MAAWFWRKSGARGAGKGTLICDKVKAEAGETSIERNNQQPHVAFCLITGYITGYIWRRSWEAPLKRAH
jgi:hypothetical protein